MKKIDNNELVRLGNINSDILTILNISSHIGWRGVRRLSINRILYFSSVFYSFMYPEEVNIFSEDYKFIVTLRGPYSNIIEKSITFLLINQFIIVDEEKDVLLLTEKNVSNIELTPNYNRRKYWIETIIYILGIYGENKIYDFIFRDPEYQNNYLSNSIKVINLDRSNQTNQTLLNFKKAFELVLKEDKTKLDDKRYLELYFDYVFSKILKGEDS